MTTLRSAARSHSTARTERNCLMKIANEFTVSAPIEDAWDVLTDLEQVIPLMPGAEMTGRDGDDVLGKVKVKVGPVTSACSSRVHVLEHNRDESRAVVH